VTSSDWHGLAEALRRAASRGGRGDAGHFVLEGTRLHERALRAGIRPTAVLLSRSFAADPSPRARRLLGAIRAAGSAVHVAPDDIVAELTAGRTFGGVLGLAPLPPFAALEELARREGALLLGAVDVVDPGNAGALARTALACGATGFLALGRTDPFHPKAVRTAMGASFKLRAAVEADAARALERLRRLGVTCVACVSREGVALPRAALDRRPLAVLIGSEAFGLSPALVAAADLAVSVPMAAGVDSLSANAAAAIVLYAAARARDGADELRYPLRGDPGS